MTKPLSTWRGRSGGSTLLIDADNEVAFKDLVARDAQFGGRVQLVQHQSVAVPAHKLFDQYGLTRLVNDDVAAADRRLERVDVQQPPLRVAPLHSVADHINPLRAPNPPAI